jgi:N-sulfoglucosamine sulfohydrolase
MKNALRFAVFLFLNWACYLPLLAASPKRPNLLIVTVDDMSCDSVGIFGCKLPGTTPNIDRFASRAFRFNLAHTVVGNCMPSRNVMWSGRYPHNNHIEGFRPLSKADKDYPVLGDLIMDAGWFTAIRHKVSHSTPYSPFPWSAVLDVDADGKRLDVKDSLSYGASLQQGIAASKKSGKPFCLILNIADPHKPFYAEGKGGVTVPDKNATTRVFTPDEVPIPGFLPDDPVIRKELSHYYSSVRRADDAVGSIFTALAASGEEGNTVVVFLSDHGMPLPFAKTQLYHHSTHTPLMVRWPGVTRDAGVDNEHMVSTVDLLPTLLEILGVPTPAGMDGRSFAPLLKGSSLPERTMVFKEHNENSGGQNSPMRAVQTKEWLYVFSPWANGKRVMSGATAGTPTCRQMRVLAKTDSKIASRIDLFDHRIVCEAYRIDQDPDALFNQIANPECRREIANLEKALEDWMVRTRDPLLEVFRRRHDAEFRETYMKQLEDGASSRLKGVKAIDDESEEAIKDKKASKRIDVDNPSAKNLIELEVIGKISRGKKATVRVKYSLPDKLGEKPIQVTLKGGQDQRIERKTIRVSGTGAVDVSFELPPELNDRKVRFAGLVGENIQNSLQLEKTEFVMIRD